MLDKKWILGIGASSALAFSALVTPFSAAAQEDANANLAPTDVATQIDNGLGTISSDQAIDTANNLVPGAQITNVHLDYLTQVAAPSFNFDFSGADLGSGLGNTTNFTFNLVYVVELENNISVTIDASTGAIVDVDDDDAIVDDGDDNGLVDEDDAIVDDNDENGVVDEDDAVVDDVVENGVVDEDDAIVDDSENGNGEENGDTNALANALATTEAPVPQANAYGYRALQVCGAGGFSELGFQNQGQCIATAVTMLQAGVDEPIEDENGNGENGSEEENGDDAENGGNGAEDETGEGNEEES